MSKEDFNFLANFERSGFVGLSSKNAAATRRSDSITSNTASEKQQVSLFGIKEEIIFLILYHLFAKL